MRIPDAHYFIALEANEIIADSNYDRTWRKDKALMIKRLWEQTYNVTFENLKDEFTLMDKEIQKSEKNTLTSCGDVFISPLHPSIFNPIAHVHTEPSP